MKQTGREIRIKHSSREMTDWSEQLITTSERCAVQCSQNDVLSCSAQGLINLHMSVLTWWMCVWSSETRPIFYSRAQFSWLRSLEMYKFSFWQWGGSYSSTKQTELLFPPKQTQACWAPVPNLAICQPAREQVPAAAFPKTPVGVH